MGGLKASYFKRIYIGFKLDFLFSLFIPLLIMVLLVTTDYRLRATGVDPDLFSLGLIGDSGGIMIKLAFILLILRYMLKALCALRRAESYCYKIIFVTIEANDISTVIVIRIVCNTVKCKHLCVIFRNIYVLFKR